MRYLARPTLRGIARVARGGASVRGSLVGAVPAAFANGLPAVLADAFSPAIFGTSVAAISELAVSCMVGFCAVRFGLLDQAAISQLSKIVYNLLLPFFICTSVVNTVTTYGVGGGLLALPLVAILQITCGLVTSNAILRLLGVSTTKPSSRRYVICSSFGNSGVLSLTLLDALFRAPYADAAVLPRAASYVSFFLLGWSPVFWSVGSSILTGGDTGRGGPRALLRKVLSPPIIGALAGLLISTLPSALLSAPGSPLRLLLGSLRNLARAYTPCALLVLAGSLAGGAAAKAIAAEPAPAAAGGEVERELSPSASVVGIMASRFILSPAIAWGLVKGLGAMGLFPSVAVDPVLTLTVLLMSCMPPAQNSVLMLQVAGDATGATQMSRMLFGLYSLSVVPMSLMLTLILGHVKL